MSLADLSRYALRHVSDVQALCGLLHERRDDPAGTIMLAGGTDFLVEVSQGALRPDPLPLVVDISSLAELQQISWTAGVLRIGAGVSYLAMQRHPEVQRQAPLIRAMTYDVGGPTIQARGTLGGNLATASPAADGVAAIAAYDPIIELRSVRGVRRLPFGELQIGYKRSIRAHDEVITAIELTPPPLGSPWIWRKIGTRQAQAISKVAFAAVAELDGDRVSRFGAAMASVAPVTALLPTVRALLLATPLSQLRAAALDDAVAADIQPIDDVRSTGSYRLHCAKAALRGFVRDLGAAV